jgi:hypothetical protein
VKDGKVATGAGTGQPPPAGGKWLCTPLSFPNQIRRPRMLISSAVLVNCSSSAPGTSLKHSWSLSAYSWIALLGAERPTLSRRARTRAFFRKLSAALAPMRLPQSQDRDMRRAPCNATRSLRHLLAARRHLPCLGPTTIRFYAVAAGFNRRIASYDTAPLLTQSVQT